jgi:hypothetical protein
MWLSLTFLYWLFLHVPKLIYSKEIWEWLITLISISHCNNEICCLFVYLLFYTPLKNFSRKWRCHHYRWRAAKLRPKLGAHGLWAGRDLYPATSAVTQGLGFSGLIQRTAPFGRLLQHTIGCGGSILTQILISPHSVASYDMLVGSDYAIVADNRKIVASLLPMSTTDSWSPTSIVGKHVLVLIFISLSSGTGDNSKFSISKQWLTRTNDRVQVIGKTLFHNLNLRET